MSEAKPEPATTPGYCSFCDKWTAKGVVIKEIHGNSGPGAVVVRHAGCVGLAKSTSDAPRTWTA
jgi:hypothetical protein